MNEGVKLKNGDSSKLIVFDLDDTLVLSNAKITVIDKKTKKILQRLTPAEFNKYLKKSNDILSFDDFNNFDILLNARLTKYMKRLISLYKKGYHISIVTARSDEKMIDKFFKKHGIRIHPELLFAVNDPKYDWDSNEIGTQKKEAIEKLINNFGYTKFLVIDDNDKILDKVKELEEEYDITLSTIKV